MSTSSYLTSVIKQFKYYKLLGEKTINQLSDDALHDQPNYDSNSIATIVKHLSGNMLSRWTDFLTSDGEKSWRQRDQEFIDDFDTKVQLIAAWEQGWKCLFDALADLTEEDLESIVYIRNIGHTIVEAINRQLAHYSYHVGQIVYIGKQIQGEDWQSLSIPLGKSETYNAEKFSKNKERGHFTDQFLDQE